MTYPKTSSHAEHSYLVRSIKPNLIASHDWHVQPICQRSFWTYRLSGVPLDRGLDCYIELPSNLVRSPVLQSQLRLPAFLRELFKTIELPVIGQAKIRLYFPAFFSSPNHCIRCGGPGKRGLGPSIEKIAQRKISKNNRQNARAARARRSWSPGSCNGLFSLGIPYRGSGVFLPTSPDPANQLPTSLIGQAQRPPGGSTALLATF